MKTVYIALSCTLPCSALQYANVHCSVLYCSNAEMSLLSVYEKTQKVTFGDVMESLWSFWDT